MRRCAAAQTSISRLLPAAAWDRRCPYQDTTAPTVLDLLGTLGPKLAGGTVIVAVGYNDFEQAYAGNIEEALTAMRNLGVKRVVWVTLRAERQSYLAMNDMIRAAAARHPEVTVADWNLYPRSHPDWFQPDGLHLGWQGARAWRRSCAQR